MSMLKTYLVLCLALLGPLWGARSASAAVILDTSVATTGDSVSGSLGDTLQVIGTFDQFNVNGATLLSYEVFGSVILDATANFSRGDDPYSNSYIEYEPTISGVSYLDKVDPGYSTQESCSLDDPNPFAYPCSIGAYQGILFDSEVSDLPSLIGDGVIDVVAEGLVANLTSINAVDVVGTATLSIELFANVRYCVDGDDPGFGANYIDGTCAEALPDYPVVGGGNGGVSVPEPSALALMAAGVLGIGFARRKKA
jgi:hypothetical protein